jgi:hypothetical protein
LTWQRRITRLRGTIGFPRRLWVEKGVSLIKDVLGYGVYLYTTKRMTLGLTRKTKLTMERCDQVRCTAKTSLTASPPSCFGYILDSCKSTLPAAHFSPNLPLFSLLGLPLEGIEHETWNWKPKIMVSRVGIHGLMEAASAADGPGPAQKSHDEEHINLLP